MLLLTTPVQHATANPAVELDPERVRHWIDSLPQKDVLETVQRLHEAIAPLNEVGIDDARRVKLLEVYYAAFDEILYFYDHLRLSMLPISPERQRLLAEDITWLYLELAKGYKIVVKNGYEAGISPKHDAGLLLSMYRAMELIVQGLVYAGRSRQAPPPLAYLEINQIYLLAEEHGVLDARVKAKAGVSNIEKPYKQLALLAVADPRKLGGDNEAFELFMALEDFAPHSILMKVPQHQAVVGRYCVDLMDDRPPRFCNRTDAPAQTNWIRILDVDLALAAIKSWLAKHQGAGQSMMNAWKVQPLQGFVKQLDKR